jgi:hypothetical protein
MGYKNVEDQRKYYQDHKEFLRERSRVWYQNNKEKKKAYQRDYTRKKKAEKKEAEPSPEEADPPPSAE